MSNKKRQRTRIAKESRRLTIETARSIGVKETESSAEKCALDTEAVID